MKYFVQTVISYISNLSKNNDSLLLTIPSFPEDITMSCAEKINHLNTKNKILIKLAPELILNWSEKNKNTAKELGWTVTEGSLTYFRNSSESYKFLFGADKVTDSSSLEDFTSCSFNNLWHIEMKKSFIDWMRSKLEDNIDLYSEDQLKSFNKILIPLYENNIAGLIPLSYWLEQLRLIDYGSNISLIYKEMLNSLPNKFDLPKLTSFKPNSSRANLKKYLINSIDFFSYNLYLNDAKKKNDLSTVKNLKEEIQQNQEVENKYFGENFTNSYNNNISFLEGLEKFIEKNDPTEKNNLLKCDFVKIHDKILKFKRPSTAKETKSKLSGNPIEVVLTSIWESLQTLKDKKTILESGNLERIEITGCYFRHDINDKNDDNEYEQALESNHQAEHYLNGLLKGIDELLPNKLDLITNNKTEIKIESNLLNKNIKFNCTNISEPYFEFKISLYFTHKETQASLFKKEKTFIWRLPKTNSYRITENLYEKANQILQKDKTLNLPVFHINYFEEVFNSNSDEETRNILLHSMQEPCLNDYFITNLYDDSWINEKTSPELHNSYKKLASKYKIFIASYSTKGLIGTIFGPTGRSKEWEELFTQYQETLKLCNKELGQHEAALILRMFSILEKKENPSIDWYGNQYEPALLITLLHPALIEMFEAQIIFQFSCFQNLVNTEFKRKDTNTAFTRSLWASYLDFSTMQSPLPGIYTDETLLLSTNSIGTGLFHKLGETKKGNSSLTTRLLLSYNEDLSEVSLTDREMFKMTNESIFLYRTLKDYYQLYPHARDGLSIAIFRNANIQPIIAAIHEFINHIFLKDNKISNPIYSNNEYTLNVTFFTESFDDTDINTWLNEWKTRWQAAESENKFQHYLKCRFSVSHRLIDRGKVGAFEKMIQTNLETDLTIIYDFISSNNSLSRQSISSFKSVPGFDLTSFKYKFPILEKASFLIDIKAEENRRTRVVSNRQFLIGSLYANLLDTIKSNVEKKDTVIVCKGDYKEWSKTINYLHEKSTWVVCIDPYIDDQLLRLETDRNQQRQIIGFGSGVGTHGEHNYTISTELFSFEDLTIKLKEAIKSLFSASAWTEKESLDIAQGILKEASKLSGLSIVRATSIEDNHIRDFMAYALIHKLIKAKSNATCSNLISLDTYRHWFSIFSNQSRPDIMWITAEITEAKTFKINIHLIECKLGNESEALIKKAISQINNGLDILMKLFIPENNIDSEIPEKKFWWLQLHRLIATKILAHRTQEDEILFALEKLSEGCFEISWQASVFYFLNNDNNNEANIVGTWSTGTLENIVANIYYIKSSFIKKIATNDKYPISWEEFISSVTKSNDNICDQLIDKCQQESPVIEDELDYNRNNDDDDDDDDNDDTEDDYRKEEDEVEEKSENKDKAANVTLDIKSTSLRSEQRILLGKTKANQDIYWEFNHPELANRHLIIFGSAGYGKSYAIQCILCELSKLGQNSLIIDYTDGFTPSKIEEKAKRFIKDENQEFVRSKPLPINPFKKNKVIEAGREFIDTPAKVAKRVGSIFKGVYNLGEQQLAALTDAIIEGLNKFNENFTLSELLIILEEHKKDPERNKGSINTLIQRLKYFIDDNPFSASNQNLGWDKLFSNKEVICKVFQLFNIDRDSAKAITEFILWDLYDFLTLYGNKDKPKVIVLDEVQSLDLNEGSPVAKYFIEGRKHGISLITATQNLRQIGGINDARVSRMFQAELKLFFRPADNELKDLAQLLNQINQNISVIDWQNRLSQLEKGECWVQGRFYDKTSNELKNKTFKIKITSLEERLKE